MLDDDFNAFLQLIIRLFLTVLRFRLLPESSVQPLIFFQKSKTSF